MPPSTTTAHLQRLYAFIIRERRRREIAHPPGHKIRQPALADCDRALAELTALKEACQQKGRTL